MILRLPSVKRTCLNTEETNEVITVKYKTTTRMKSRLQRCFPVANHHLHTS